MHNVPTDEDVVLLGIELATINAAQKRIKDAIDRGEGDVDELLAELDELGIWCTELGVVADGFLPSRCTRRQSA